MGNKNYEKGRRFEYERAAHHRARGCEVMRTAGSHGLFDLVLITPNGHVEFVQCKVTSDEGEARRMINAFRANPPMGLDRNADYNQVMEVKILGKGVIDTIV